MLTYQETIEGTFDTRKKCSIIANLKQRTHKVTSITKKQRRTISFSYSFTSTKSHFLCTFHEAFNFVVALHFHELLHFHISCDSISRKTRRYMYVLTDDCIFSNLLELQLTMATSFYFKPDYAFHIIQK